MRCGQTRRGRSAARDSHDPRASKVREEGETSHPAAVEPEVISHPRHGKGLGHRGGLSTFPDSNERRTQPWTWPFSNPCTKSAGRSRPCTSTPRVTPRPRKARFGSAGNRPDVSSPHKGWTRKHLVRWTKWSGTPRVSPGYTAKWCTRPAARCCSTPLCPNRHRTTWPGADPCRTHCRTWWPRADTYPMSWRWSTASARTCAPSTRTGVR